MRVYKRFHLLLIVFAASVSFSCRAEQTPWRLSNKLSLPSWLQITGQHRSRYETLDQQFRKAVNGRFGQGGDQALMFRTLMQVKVGLSYLRMVAELEDSRIALADQGTATTSHRLSTNAVNPLELLQAYLQIPIDGLLIADSQSNLRIGRITMDIGSRRLLARNRFRNAINAFTGVHWRWRADDRQINAFYTLPVRRVIDGNIRDNHEKFDQEHEQLRFWGLHYQQKLFGADHNGEVFLFGLDESDGDGFNTRERELYTFGWRLWRQPKLNAFDFQFEGAYQLGESKRSASSTTRLNHAAHFHHAEIAYSFAAPMSPRLIVQYDYASGDDDSNDTDNNRFDTLYGARRFDFGPTSIYGPFARSNINSPGLRLTLKPCVNVQTLLSLRGFWRASTRDAWTVANINGDDPYIGSQIEARIRWDALPGNLRLETGFAHIFAGDLMRGANKQNTTYGYTQAVMLF